jgi:hypothetical protein
MARTGRPRTEGSQPKPGTGQQARGSRKGGKAKNPAAAGDLGARQVVQWLRDNTKHNLTNVAMFTGLEYMYSFVRRWAARDSAGTMPGRGPKHIVPDSDCVVLPGCQG